MIMVSVTIAFVYLYCIYIRETIRKKKNTCHHFMRLTWNLFTESARQIATFMKNSKIPLIFVGRCATNAIRSLCHWDSVSVTVDRIFTLFLAIFMSLSSTIFFLLLLINLQLVRIVSFFFWYLAKTIGSIFIVWMWILFLN